MAAPGQGQSRAGSAGAGQERGWAGLEHGRGWLEEGWTGNWPGRAVAKLELGFARAELGWAGAGLDWAELSLSRTGAVLR